MKKTIIRLITNLAERYILPSSILNRIWCLYFILDFHKLYADRGLDYENLSVEVSGREPPLGDERTNFIARVILDNSYERVIEIGGYDLMRPLYYKNSFPDIDVWALDILPEFESKIVEGINIAAFELEWFKQNAGDKTLITSTGTLPYMSPQELTNFLDLIYFYKYDLAISEIGSHFAKTESLKRSITSYYHPYTHLLQQLGYSINVTHPNHAFSLSGMERREFILATTSN